MFGRRHPTHHLSDVTSLSASEGARLPLARWITQRGAGSLQRSLDTNRLRPCCGWRGAASALSAGSSSTSVGRAQGEEACSLMLTWREPLIFMSVRSRRSWAMPMSSSRIRGEVIPYLSSCLCLRLPFTCLASTCPALPCLDLPCLDTDRPLPLAVSSTHSYLASPWSYCGRYIVDASLHDHAQTTASASGPCSRGGALTLATRPDDPLVSSSIVTMHAAAQTLPFPMHTAHPRPHSP